MNATASVALAALATLWHLPAHAQSSHAERTLKALAVHSQPKRVRQDTTGLASLREQIEAEPNARRLRFDLVRGLIDAGLLDEAELAATQWREHDAYNLVVVRLLGDIYSEQGKKAKAMRTYSAVVELLPKDAMAHRALASVLKQAGQLQAARDRLSASLEIRPDDARLRFELADLVQRLGGNEKARTLFESIVSDPSTPKLLRGPAKERLAQSYQSQRKMAQRDGDSELALDIGKKLDALELEGGLENDIKIYLTWDTDRSDVDLWVTNPKGEKVFYSNKQGKLGGKLFGDVTNGYGPESFTAKAASPGSYKIQVNYYSAGSSNFPEARGEVVVVTNEGKTHEARQVFPYRLFKKGQTVTVAKIAVR